uniref:SPEF1 protein n=1 Tax=Anser brachyrhynchus TaxID=132585 RepID=A0A8B9C3R5_9AVES
GWGSAAPRSGAVGAGHPASLLPAGLGERCPSQRGCGCWALCLPAPRRAGRALPLAAGPWALGALPPCPPACRFGSFFVFRKVLSKLNFSLPDEVIRQVVQCRPGTVEQVLLLLRQKIEEKQKQSKAVPGPEQELGARTAQEEVGYLETGRAGYSEAKSTGQGCAQESPGAAGGSRSHLGYARHPAGDTAAIHLQLAEKEQALLLAQETVQLLQMKVRRLEQLLRLKDTRIDDLSRRLQQAQRQPR